MLHRTVWDAPSASSKKEVSFRLETGVENVTSNCMGCAVCHFDKEVSFRLETGVENITSNWFPGVCFFKDELTTRKSLKAFFLQPKL